MKFTEFCSLLSLLFLCGYSKAQCVIPSTHDLLFKPTYVGQTDTQYLELFNPWNEYIRVSIRSTSEWWDNQFTAYPQSLAPGDTVKFPVVFEPVQNVLSEGYLMINGDVPFGPIVIKVIGQGLFDNPYYDRTQDLYGEELLLSLKEILTENQDTFSYNKARDLMFMEVDNLRHYPNGPDSNTVQGLYTRREIIGFANRKEAQAMGFNTEHVWPQSSFGKKLPMKSDLHHLYPTDAEANNRRSNYPFGPIKKLKWEKMGARLGAEGVFLPPNYARGKVARAMLYVATRYENYQDFLAGQEELLVDWHLTYRPTDWDQFRNERVFQLQGNRNPFVDYPQLVYRIPSFQRDDSWLMDRKVTCVYAGQERFENNQPPTKYPLMTVALANSGPGPLHIREKMSSPDPNFNLILANIGNAIAHKLEASPQYPYVNGVSPQEWELAAGEFQMFTYRVPDSQRIQYIGFDASVQFEEYAAKDPAYFLTSFTLPDSSDERAIDKWAHITKYKSNKFICQVLAPEVTALKVYDTNARLLYEAPTLAKKRRCKIKLDTSQHVAYLIVGKTPTGWKALHIYQKS